MSPHTAISALSAGMGPAAPAREARAEKPASAGLSPKWGQPRLAGHPGLEPGIAGFEDRCLLECRSRASGAKSSPLSLPGLVERTRLVSLGYSRGHNSRSRVAMAAR